MSALTLYHAGFQVIEAPDLHYGRKNADFGQGFYCSADPEFCRRWARERRGEESWLNVYTLETEGLQIHRFARDEAWFDYVFRNRAGYTDPLSDCDLIVGPIANDTIYNTLGIFTSGVLSRDRALALLRCGPAYEQTVLKTERAAAHLRFVSAERLSGEALAARRALLRAEEAQYQEEIAAYLAEEGEK